MNLVDFSINYVVNGPTDIPDYLLKLAFDNPNNGLGFGNVWGPVDDQYSVEQGIREKVIMGMVAPLLNVAGGTTEIIDISTAIIKNVDGGIIYVNVPDYLTGGRRIMSVLEIYPGNLNRAITNGYNFTQSEPCDGAGVQGNALNRLLTGLDNGNTQRVLTNITMTGNKNSFIIRDAGSAMFNMIAKCVLAYDEHFSVIPPKAYDAFARLIELGVKTYIYKKCRRGAQEAVSRFGVSVDSVTDDIAEFRDSSKDFKELYEEEIKKTLQYADPKGLTDTISFLIPRRR